MGLIYFIESYESIRGSRTVHAGAEARREFCRTKLRGSRAAHGALPKLCIGAGLWRSSRGWLGKIKLYYISRKGEYT